MIRHPAKYSDSLIPVMRHMLLGRKRILDPFGGVGKLHRVNYVTSQIVCGEIEYEWAKHGSDLVHDALRLPFADETFDAICTSPCYGNRMADHHHAKDPSRRTSYTHCLGKTLHPNNSGQLQWGEAYREFHVFAWKESIRVLKNDGIFILNVSNHIRKGKEIDVTRFHIDTLTSLGLGMLFICHVPTPRNRFGENRELRIDKENVILFAKEKIHEYD